VDTTRRTIDTVMSCALSGMSSTEEVYPITVPVTKPKLHIA
jgi:hypothetical protein